MSCLVNPRRACARGLVLGRSVRPSFLLSFRLSVCYHVFCDYAQRDNKTAIPTPHWLRFKKRRFSYNCCVRKLWREKQVKEPICKLAQAYLHRVRSLCVSWRHKKSQRRACIDSRLLSTTVASPCQTLRELYTSGIPRGKAYKAQPIN